MVWIRLLPIGERCPYASIANLGVDSEQKTVQIIRRCVPQNVDFTPHRCLSFDVADFDEVLAEMDLNDSRQIPTDLSLNLRNRAECEEVTNRDKWVQASNVQ